MTSSPKQILTAAEQDFRAAIQQALDATVATAGPQPVAIDLVGLLARYGLFAEVAALARASHAYTLAYHTFVVALEAKDRREHEGVVRDDDTPDYLREGAEPSEDSTS